MSLQITTAFVKQFSSNMYFLAQQKGSKLAPLVRKETQNSEKAFYEQIGSVTAQEKVGRHSEVTYTDTPHSRRAVSTRSYFHADLIDSEDKIRMLISPESDYSKLFMWALGRKMDDVIIAAALGSAYTGADGTTPVALANANKVAGFDGATTTGVGLNVKVLRAVKKKFHQNEIDEGDLYFAISAEQLDNLLGQTEVTSADYASVKALVQGDVDSFMGFKFIRLERLPATSSSTTYDVVTGAVGSGGGTLPSGARRCFAWKKDGLLMAVGMEAKARIDEIPQKHYSKQVYASMDMGAVRMEEVKVVEVLVKE